MKIVDMLIVGVMITSDGEKVKEMTTVGGGNDRCDPGSSSINAFVDRVRLWRELLNMCAT